MTTTTDPDDNIIILGCGIIGLSTAYYLSLSPTNTAPITLIDPTPELFSSASGFAGGFLAKDWFSPALTPLGALSFNEHARLAAENNGGENWGYTPSTCISYIQYHDGSKQQKRGDDWLRSGTSRVNAAPVEAEQDEGRRPVWLKKKEGDKVEVISEEGTTAQVDPSRLCQWLLGEVTKKGGRVLQPAKATELLRDDSTGQVKGVVVKDLKDGSGRVVKGNRIVITAGVWTPSVFKTLFPLAKVEMKVGSLAGHSIVVRTPDPEKGKARPLEEQRGLLREAVGDIIGGGDAGLEVVREGLCFRPVTEWGAPIVSRITQEDIGINAGYGGVWVAAGHGPWGIAMSLGTGVVMAEMVEGVKTSVNLSLKAS
ncbi:FAD dependent oxidoreductase-domain-containing protein [Cercophora samala]|uniref:FAD dependent oxidoreductase-domain-containing protein n=1 Tax=Cercophora samala TaxID=330535 RepID=A0AA39ZCX3_9PEZI|nr:FAD dependent oxidoreductase-domain-containing protein [Cercophora samala]